MKKFIVIYYAPASAQEAMGEVSPEAQEKVMAAWMAWKAKNDANIIDFGAPLMPGYGLDGTGTWTANTTGVSGYSILSGESEAAIQGILGDHPHLQWAEGATIAVHECVAM